MCDSDDENPQLSAHALAALQEFYQEQAAYQDKEVAIAAGTAEPEMPAPDWQMSQFWYDEKTTEALAEEALAVAKPDGRIACVSCPSLYQALRKLKPDSCTVVILEYDRRFERFKKDFVFYDYNQPLDLPNEMERAFDLVVLDPPFLSEDCLCKVAVTAKYIAKEKILLCTGATMEDAAKRLLNALPLKFIPRHTQNLANEFRCYTNYSPLVLDS